MHQIMTFFAFGLWLATIAPLSMAQVNIDEIGILENTKEAQTGVIKEQEILELKARYNNQDFNEKIKTAFYQTIQTFLNHDLSECESHVILHFEENLKERNIKTSEVYNETYFKILRVNHHIDDIVYKIITALNEDYYTFKAIDQEFPNISTSIDNHDNPNYVKQFRAFKTWPDEINTCQYTEFANLLNDIELNAKKVTRKKKLRELRRLSKNAYSQGIISKNTHLKLKYLSKKSKAVKSRLWLSDYYDQLKAVKDSMVPRNLKNEIVDITLESKFSSVQLKRLKIFQEESNYILSTLLSRLAN